MKRRYWLPTCFVLGAGLVVLLAAGVTEYRVRTGLGLARAAMAQRQFAKAREQLEAIRGWRPLDPDALFEQGICERELGRREQALRLWSHIRPNAGVAPKAAFERARIVLDNGHMEEAEEILEPFAARSSDARHLLIRLWQTQGRIDDVKRLYRQTFDLDYDPIGVLGELWKLDNEPYPVEGVSRYLGRLSRQSPNDASVRYGRANLALHKGVPAEAKPLLDGLVSEGKKPNRLLLDYALAIGDADRVRAVANALPADRFSPGEITGLRAWLAGSAGDAASETAALERRRSLDPGHIATIDRLAELLIQQGKTREAAELREQGARIRKLRREYEKGLGSEHPRAKALELARLADELGLPFEASCWKAISNSKATSKAINVVWVRDSTASSGQTLAQAIGHAGENRSEKVRNRRFEIGPIPMFQDDAVAVGIAFTYNNGRSSLRQLPETMSGGVGLLDYDGDGWLDVYLVQGGVFPPDPGSAKLGSSDRLLRNRGDGSFEDATKKAGIAAMPGGYGHGVCVGDFDNDGYPDLFITRWRSYALYRNRGDGRFEDATEATGLGGDRDWPTSAAWGDFDGDGDLDLYVCHYLKWDSVHPKICRQDEAGKAFYCTPRDFASEPDHLFRNDRGRFVDVTDQAGIVDREGRGLGVVSADLDGDGKLDIFVANDMSANFLFHNLGGMKFAESAFEAGVACNSEGSYQAGMGVDFDDLDRDGKPDLVVTNFYGEATTFYRNLGRGLFSDHTAEVGLEAASRYLLGFGVTLFDANNDGWLDLASGNGHVNDGTPKLPYEMPAQFLMGIGGGSLIDKSSSAGPVWHVPRLARGLARGDLDNDGKLDLVLISQNQPAAYFHNCSSKIGHWIAFSLVGTKSPRDGHGAWVRVTSAGTSQTSWRSGGGSYESASDPRLHFGLGPSARAQIVEIHWPSGQVDCYNDLIADARYEAREGIDCKRTPPPVGDGM